MPIIRFKSFLEREYNDVGMKVREVLRLIEADGWRFTRQAGSHRIFHHPDKPGIVIIAGKPSQDLAPGTLNAILKEAGLKGKGK